MNYYLIVMLINCILLSIVLTIGRIINIETSNNIELIITIWIILTPFSLGILWGKMFPN